MVVNPKGLVPYFFSGLSFLDRLLSSSEEVGGIGPGRQFSEPTRPVCRQMGPKRTGCKGTTCRLLPALLTLPLASTPPRGRYWSSNFTQSNITTSLQWEYLDECSVNWIHVCKERKHFLDFNVMSSTCQHHF